MSPFDESRYRDLLSGLEAAEINTTEIKKVDDQRIDAEYFQRKFLANAMKLTKCCVPAQHLQTRKKLGTVKNLQLTRDFNYLEISGIDLNGMGYETSLISPDAVPHRANIILRNGDVVVSLVRPNRNAVALIRNAKRIVGTSGFLVLRTDSPHTPPPPNIFSPTVKQNILQPH